MCGGFVERDGVGEGGEVVGCGLHGEGSVGDVLHVGDDGVDGDWLLRRCEERGGEEDGGGGEFHDCGQRRGGRASEEDTRRRLFVREVRERELNELTQIYVFALFLSLCSMRSIAIAEL